MKMGGSLLLVVAWIVAAVHVEAQPVSNTVGAVCLRIVGESGAPLTNAIVANAVANGEAETPPVRMTDAAGYVRFDHPIAPWFFVCLPSGASMHTNTPLSRHGATNVVIMKTEPNQPVQTPGKPAPERIGAK
jgi:hypothetical protein